MYGGMIIHLDCHLSFHSFVCCGILFTEASGLMTKYQISQAFGFCLHSLLISVLPNHVGVLLRHRHALNKVNNLLIIGLKIRI